MYFFQESILTKKLDDTPTYEVTSKSSCYTYLALQIIFEPVFGQYYAVHSK